MADDWKPTHELTPYEEHPVVQTTVAIRNTGDGLSNALAVAPVELHHGDRVIVAIECVVEKLRYDPSKNPPDDLPDALVRVHMLKAEGATIIDSGTVEKQIAKMNERVRQAKENALGIQRLDLDRPDGAQEVLDRIAAEQEASG